MPQQNAEEVDKSQGDKLLNHNYWCLLFRVIKMLNFGCKISLEWGLYWIFNLHWQILVGSLMFCQIVHCAVLASIMTNMYNIATYSFNNKNVLTYAISAWQTEHSSTMNGTKIIVSKLCLCSCLFMKFRWWWLDTRVRSCRRWRIF